MLSDITTFISHPFLVFQTVLFYGVEAFFLSVIVGLARWYWVRDFFVNHPDLAEGFLEGGIFFFLCILNLYILDQSWIITAILSGVFAAIAYKVGVRAVKPASHDKS